MSQAAAATDRFSRDWPVTYVIAPAVRGLARYFRARASGVEHIPADRPVIYVGKHPRTWLYFETMLLGLFAFWDSGRPAFRVLEQKGTSLHRAPVVGWLRRHVSGIPASADAALGALAHGESVLVFPGGTRELYGPPDTLQWSGRLGFARLAARARAPVLPFAMAGADRQHPWRLALGRTSLWLPPFPLPVRLEFRFGRPMTPPPPEATAEEIGAFASEVEAATQSLIRGGVRS